MYITQATWFRLLLLLCGFFCSLLVNSAKEEWQQMGGSKYRKLPSAATNLSVGLNLLNPETLGISFTNTLPDLLMRTRQYSLNGAGLALGDYDGDSLPDIFFCNKGGSSKLYKNLGGWRFADVTESTGVSCKDQSSTGALFADLNGDGWLDLLVTAFGGPNAVFLNESGKKFTNITISSGFSSRGNMTSMAAADIDGDGGLEIYVCNFGLESIGGDGISLATRVIDGQTKVQGRFANRAIINHGRLLELGDQDWVLGSLNAGRFQNRDWEFFFTDAAGKPMRAPWDFGLAVQFRDINGDGMPDIYVCNDFQTPDRLWLNDGIGKFKLAPTHSQRTQPYASMGVDFADFNRDGLLDYFAVEMLPTKRTSRIQAALPYQSGSRAKNSINEQEQVARNCLYLNRGDGTYAEIAQMSGVSASDWSWCPLFIDLDLDGYEDLLISNGNLKDLNNLDDAESKNGAQGNASSLFLQPLLTPNSVYRNRKDLTFADMQGNWGFNATNISQGMAMADLDGDGDMDVVVNTLNGPPLIYRNECIAPRLKVRLKGLAPNQHGVGGLIYVRSAGLVQMQEIICGGQYLSSSEMARTFAGFSITNHVEVEVRWRSGHRTILKDVPANGELIVIETASPESALKAPPVENGSPLFQLSNTTTGLQDGGTEFDDFAHQSLLPRKLSHVGPRLVSADINEDGRMDLFFGSSAGGRLSVVINHQEGWKKWIPPQSTNSTNQWGFEEVLSGQTQSVASWTNRSGELMLAASISAGQGGTGQVRIAHIQKGQLKETITLHFNHSNPTALAPGDVDGDGIQELFVGGGPVQGRWPESTESFLLRRTPQGWKKDDSLTPILHSTGLVNSALWIDLDGDAKKDLVTVGEWGAPHIYYNKNGTLVSASAGVGLEEMKGWWNDIAGGDFDGDGKMDLLISNWGLNTPWSGSSTQSANWSYGEIEGATSFVVLEAAFDPELQQIVPQRPLNELAAVWPGLRERFPTHAAFSKISVGEVLGNVAPGMKRAEAGYWKSTLFLNRGRHFEPHPLPPAAQIAPVFGIGVADFNGDGHLDAFLAQNFFAIRPALSRCDAGQGLVLLGDGKGEFQPLGNRSSGVVMEGEQRSVVVADFNGDRKPDVAVTQYGQPVTIWNAVR